MINLSIVQEVKAMEIKTIEGLDYTYTITTEGNIYKQPTGKLLKVSYQDDIISPYAFVRLPVNGKYVKFSVAQLVLDNFVGRTDEDEELISLYPSHKDYDYRNCSLDNLEYDILSNIHTRQLEHSNKVTKESIKEVMKSNGITLSALSYVSIISSQWLESWLNGDTQFDSYKVRVLANIVEHIDYNFKGEQLSADNLSYLASHSGVKFNK
ncbi:hypothetical protein [Bacillus sp. UNC322MFChir4.1]|uniref:hypothetical protein n=1 Tax=Bacillus sp. UNC322MFChir4.1 TaxID=1449045 RepID=UPI0005518460|nr:hypothetical protein [Bacillus sp. UNC322MFChir4.1]